MTSGTLQFVEAFGLFNLHQQNKQDSHRSLRGEHEKLRDVTLSPASCLSSCSLSSQVTGHLCPCLRSELYWLIPPAQRGSSDQPRPATCAAQCPGRAGAKYDTKFVLEAAKVAPIPDILPSRGNKTLTFNKNSAGPAIMAN